MGGAFHHAAIALAQTIGFSLEERQIVLDLLKGVTTRGQSVDELHAAVLSRLGRRDFRWPEVDRWQAFFAGRWEVPPAAGAWSWGSARRERRRLPGGAARPSGSTPPVEGTAAGPLVRNTRTPTRPFTSRGGNERLRMLVRPPPGRGP